MEEPSVRIFSVFPTFLEPDEALFSLTPSSVPIVGLEPEALLKAPERQYEIKFEFDHIYVRNLSKDFLSWGQIVLIWDDHRLEITSRTPKLWVELQETPLNPGQESWHTIRMQIQTRPPFRGKRVRVEVREGNRMLNSTEIVIQSRFSLGLYDTPNPTLVTLGSGNGLKKYLFPDQENTDSWFVSFSRTKNPERHLSDGLWTPVFCAKLKVQGQQVPYELHFAPNPEREFIHLITHDPGSLPKNVLMNGIRM